VAFKGVGLLFGLMASLGGSQLVGQAISGLVVMYTRSFRVGELVRIGETEGMVTSVNVLSVKVRTIRNEEFTIPTSLVLGTVTKNYSSRRDAERLSARR
jgi:small-conductance mechanosensitive channel